VEPWSRGTMVPWHDTVERKFGFPDDGGGFVVAREAAYERLFGETLSVPHELTPQVPQIDVYTCRRKRGDRFVYLQVPGGMSDQPLTMRRGAEDEPKRVELIFQCAEPREEYHQTSRWLVHFPHNSMSWLRHGHTSGALLSESWIGRASACAAGWRQGPDPA
jgi:hypothetical protein